MMTGKLDKHGRWTDELWEVKKYIERITSLSISGITMEEIRSVPVLRQDI